MMGEARLAVGVRRDFIARHFLIGGDWGRENEPHAHHYRVEVTLEGRGTDRHGYLVDIVRIETGLEEVIARYRDTLLNDLPEFAERNPSLERFATCVHDELVRRIGSDEGGVLAAMTVTLWENEQAWASCRREYA